MDITKAKEASKLLKEIEELELYKDILNDRNNGKVSHFEFVEHYGSNPSTVVFSHEYTPKFIEVVEEIIESLRTKLSKI